MTPGAARALDRLALPAQPARLEAAVADQRDRDRRRGRGVSALIVIIGVMNGLQNDLREKILIGSPDIRVLTFGDDIKMDDWQATLREGAQQPGSSRGAVRHDPGGRERGHDYAEGCATSSGSSPTRRRGAGGHDHPPDAVRATSASRARTAAARVVLGKLADRLGVVPGRHRSRSS